MDAYLNELSVRVFSNNEEAQDAFLLLGKCLHKMSELGVSNVRMTNEIMKKRILPGQTWNRILNNETVIGKDLKSVLINKLCTLEPIDNLEDKYNVLEFSYNKIPCKGLGWASESMENTLALGFRQENVWDNGSYNVDINLLDEDGNELPLTSGCKHVVSPDEVETHRDFLLKKINIPTNGKVLAKRSAKLFPHLRFAEQASNQLEKIKDPVVVQQVYWRLLDLERVAANSTSSISPEKFKYKTTPESETRSRLPQLKILFLDGKTRLCSWHSRFTPSAGRIHFCPNESEQIFYIGYIGEKIAD